MKIKLTMIAVAMAAAGAVYADDWQYGGYGNDSSNDVRFGSDSYGNAWLEVYQGDGLTQGMDNQGRSWSTYRHSRDISQSWGSDGSNFMIIEY